MKTKYFILSAFLFFSSNELHASFSRNDAESSIHPNSLKEKFLMKKYGEDPAVRSFIHYWFLKRLGFAMLSGGGGALSIVFTTVISKSGGRNTTAADGALLPPAFLLAVIGALAWCTFLIFFLIHSRKKLVHLLEDYKGGKPIAKKYQKRIDSYKRKKK
jgi:hypothetical protein